MTFLSSGQIRNEDTMQMDVVPGGHLIQDRVNSNGNGVTRMHSFSETGSRRNTGMRREKVDKNVIRGEFYNYKLHVQSQELAEK